MRKMIDSLQFHKKLLLTLLLSFIFILSLTGVNWNEELVHHGGAATLAQLFESLLQPDLSPQILLLGISSTGITLAYAVAGMTLAILLAFLFGIFASGVLSDGKKLAFLSNGFFRGILGFMRAIHELIWAWLFVAAFGLTPFSAIFALAIPYGGILGKIFADMLNDVPQKPIEALKAAGASKLQCLLYGYFPAVRSNMISYTMYRFECAIRSSAIMSFVGLGGLGYQLQLSLDDLNYSEVWTFMFFLIAIVVLVDLWSNQIRNSFLDDKARPYQGKISLLFAALLMIGSWLFITVVEKASLIGLFTEKNLNHAVQFVRGLMGIGEELPAFASWESWSDALALTFDTFMMSIMAIGFATIAMFLTVIPAASKIANGSLTMNKGWYGRVFFVIVRSIYIFSRAVPELVWAMIIIFIFKPGILPGAIALALHNFGILGKLCAEVIEDIDTGPIRNLSLSGASRSQLFIYGIIPAVMPKFLTFILYRWEVIMRTTIIVGFVGAGGLGQQFKMSMSYFHYSDITLIIFCYLILVFIADSVSELMRKAAK
ncbi:ABC transporter permease [Bacillus canaveralius]|uniref:ABC transporter permease n=1 Tax=Bacillus canaveralius TaxID=1403243 RepID=A0A2N5GLG1_9BACI|nr:ABC transporter permease subunit [Bacillus canaveralius]PLR82477.1 ABC transporter permease [Bacillus canaveralius]PLR95648.1 ABC transporter permease [Bacillus canaveralius]